RLTGSLVAPYCLAFLDERAHALLGVGGEGVHAHDFLGVGVGLGLVEVDLGVEGLLADGDGDLAGRCDAIGEGAGLGGERIGGDHAVHQAPVGGGVGVDRSAGE